MRYLIMHKNDKDTEAGKPPPMELVHAMGELIGEYARTGRFLDGAGLKASKSRSRLVFRGGTCTTTHGPYRGAHELPTAMHVLEVRSRDQALDWAARYGAILGDAELEVGEVNEPWDIGVMPRPADPPLHMLLVEMERAGRTAEQRAALARLTTEMTEAGVLQRSIRLQPSAGAKRLDYQNRKARVIDGPFAESKELIGGFAVLELADLDEVLSMCDRYAAILGGTVEIDVRLVDLSG